MFFENFRSQLGRYAEGVHELDRPASPSEIEQAEARLGRALPKLLASFYRSWNGARLFTDSIVLERIDRVAVDDRGDLRIGEALGAGLAVDASGRVCERDEGDHLVVGSTIERWLDAQMAREGLLVDHEGEWKEVFAPGDGVMKPEVRRKRVRVALKADAEAAAWHLEAAELAFEEGDAEEAERELRRAVELDAGAGAGWELLGALERRAGRSADAELAFVRAAEASGEPRRRAERWAEAARAADEAGRSDARREHAMRAGGAEAWIEEARRLAEEGDLEGALNRATLAQAVCPGEEIAAIVRHLRARRALSAR